MTVVARAEAVLVETSVSSVGPRSDRRRGAALAPSAGRGGFTQSDRPPAAAPWRRSWARRAALALVHRGGGPVGHGVLTRLIAVWTCSLSRVRSGPVRDPRDAVEQG